MTDLEDAIQIIHRITQEHRLNEMPLEMLLELERQLRYLADITSSALRAREYPWANRHDG